MFIVNGPHRVFAGPEERNVSEANTHPSPGCPGTPVSSLTTFRSSGTLVFG
jgi:hypothetical protein